MGEKSQLERGIEQDFQDLGFDIESYRYREHLISTILKTFISRSYNALEAVKAEKGSALITTFIPQSYKALEAVKAEKGSALPYRFDDYRRKVVILAAEYLRDNDDSLYLRSRFEASDPEVSRKSAKERKCNSLPKFLNDIILAPNGLLWELVKKPRAAQVVLDENCGFVPREEGKPIYRHLLETLGIEVDPLLLAEYLIAKAEGDGKETNDTNYQVTIPNVHFSSRVFKETGKEYQASFSSNLWRNLYHDVETCKFNGMYEMISAMLDCADPHIHHLHIMPTTEPVKSTKVDGKEKYVDRPTHYIAPQIVAILVDAVDTKTDQRYLVVEGVFGTPWGLVEKEPTPGQQKMMDFYHQYIYDSIFEMTAKSNKGVFINTCFVGHYPSQGSTDFVNFVAKLRGEKKPHYVLEISSEECKYKQRQKQPFNLNLRKEASPEVDRLFTSYRRLNTWFEDMKRQ